MPLWVEGTEMDLVERRESRPPVLPMQEGQGKDWMFSMLIFSISIVLPCDMSDLILDFAFCSRIWIVVSSCGLI